MKLLSFLCLEVSSSSIFQGIFQKCKSRSVRTFDSVRVIKNYLAEIKHPGRKGLAGYLELIYTANYCFSPFRVLDLMLKIWSHGLDVLMAFLIPRFFTAGERCNRVGLSYLGSSVKNCSKHHQISFGRVSKIHP